MAGEGKGTGGGNERGRLELELRDRDKLEAWLRKQSREVCVAIAARAALRVPPGLGSLAGKAEVLADDRAVIVLRALRAVAAPWAATKYPARGAALRNAAFVAGYAAIDAASDADSAAFAAFAAADAVFNAASGAAIDAVHAAFAAADVAAFDSVARGTPISDSAARSAAAFDAAEISYGGDVSEVLSYRLWPRGEPEWSRALWPLLVAALPADEHWDVWTRWWEARRDGLPPGHEEVEIFRVTGDPAMGEDFWRQEPKVINEVIWRKEQEYLKPPDRTADLTDMPAPVANAPSAVDFAATPEGKIGIVGGAANLPILPFPDSESDHQDALDACRRLGENLLRALKSGRFQAREDYAIELARYLEYLPSDAGRGSCLLANTQAGILLDMFREDKEVLSAPFAASLRAVLQHNMGLRPFYPQIAEHNARVRTGRMRAPLPLDPARKIREIIRSNSPTTFDPGVGEIIDGAARPVPEVKAPAPEDRPPPDPNKTRPPVDPDEDVDRVAAQRLTWFGTLNALYKAVYKVVLDGEKLQKGYEGVKKIAIDMAPYMAAIVEWLRMVLL